MNAANLVMIIGGALAVALLWPTADELERYRSEVEAERREKGPDEAWPLEIGLVLVILGGVFAATVAMHACGGAL
jgi:hypothetical protein